MDRLHNRTLDYFNLTDLSDIHFMISLHSWVILPIALPLICLAIYGLFSLIKKDHVAPVYVINLLVSDILQICMKPIAFSLSADGTAHKLIRFVYSIGLSASVFFMVCIAGERYVMIAHPLWYRFHRTIKKSLICCFIVWMVAIITVGGVIVVSATSDFRMENVFNYAIGIYLLPYPFVLFFFIGTWRALSKSISLTDQEQRRIMGTLALVLFIYTVLFMPYMVMLLLMQAHLELISNRTFQQFCMTTSFLLSLNPLTDPILYVIARKKCFLTLPCYCCAPPLQVENRRSLTQETEANDEETHV